MSGLALEAVLARERAATELRHWVRLTRRCNNGCLFCHDAGRQDGSVVPFTDVGRDILEGRGRGATRLVLSGGEPTLHPRFAEAVAAGARAGYRWVQVVSNGRMFAYERFTERAVASGLDEATVSVHGHTPELHDRLVGARGAFAQSIRGVKNLLRAGRVVSIDVVVARPNVRHLADILRFFTGLGIREFDLLSLVPFGRAFDEHRAELFFDPAEEREHVLEALRMASEPGMHVWTNRWPAPLLEGAEHLIQDPHKILDEVRGAREGFQAYLATGEPPECRGDRCRACFLEHFCRSLEEDRARLQAGELEVVALDAAQVESLGPARLEALSRQRRAAYRLSARTAREIAAALERLPSGPTAALELDLERLSDLPPALASRVTRVVLREGDDLPAAMRLGADVEVALERGREDLARRAAALAPDRAVLTLPGRALLSEVVAREPEPREIADLAGASRAEGLPRCLAPRSERARPVLAARSLDGAGRIDLLAWTESYIRERYRAKSLRCRGCADASACEGAHVNTIRARGFGWMRPRGTT
jgi:molybdenum cofactor biosynthesis enzyme MoaA